MSLLPPLRLGPIQFQQSDGWTGDLVLEQLEAALGNRQIQEVPETVRQSLYLEQLLEEYKASVGEYVEVASQPVLSTQTLNSRRALLASATVCLAMGYFGIIPNGLPAIGIQRGALSDGTAMALGLCILLYTTFTFAIDSMRDLRFRESKLKRIQNQSRSVGYKIAQEGLTQGKYLTEVSNALPTIVGWGRSSDMYLPIGFSFVSASSILLNLLGLF